MTDQELMQLAIQMAELCKPADSTRVPKVGAVIAVGGSVITTGYRGTGSNDSADPKRGHHAERMALDNIPNKEILRNASVFTTLEPCTPHVRTNPHECCTDRLIRARVKKVFVGMLDPNQGVCGKGVLELQKNDIEVELFPHELAERIRRLNDDFICAQQTLGVTILSPTGGQEIKTYETDGKFMLECEFITPPDDKVFVITHLGDGWWPQFGRFQSTERPNVFKVQINFGSYGVHTIHVVKANPLGVGLINYYRKVTRLNCERHDKIKQRLENHELEAKQIDAIFADLPGKYPGFEIGVLPKGLDSQAFVTVTIPSPPKIAAPK